MESIKVAIQLHWFLWPPRYVKTLLVLQSQKSSCSTESLSVVLFLGLFQMMFILSRSMVPVFF